MPDLTVVIDNTCSQCNRDGLATYLTEARCSNCGWTGEMRHSLTHEKGYQNHRCPRCEARSVRAGDFIARDDEITTASSEMES